MKYAEECFEQKVVNLDETDFTKCTFTNCELVYSGGGLPSLNECTFNNCFWTFSGASSNTINFMTALYHGAGISGKTTVEETFNSIRHRAIPAC